VSQKFYSYATVGISPIVGALVEVDKERAKKWHCRKFINDLKISDKEVVVPVGFTYSASNGSVCCVVSYEK
jgi:hypothetical protein